MKFVKKTIISLFLISAFTVSNQVQATENGRYEIVQCENRTFLLDKATGNSWRYFYNTLEIQGWSKVNIYGLN